MMGNGFGMWGFRVLGLLALIAVVLLGVLAARTLGGGISRGKPDTRAARRRASAPTRLSMNGSPAAN